MDVIVKLFNLIISRVFLLKVDTWERKNQRKRGNQVKLKWLWYPIGCATLPLYRFLFCLIFTKTPNVLIIFQSSLQNLIRKMSSSNSLTLAVKLVRKYLLSPAWIMPMIYGNPAIAHLCVHALLWYYCFHSFFIYKKAVINFKFFCLFTEEYIWLSSVLWIYIINFSVEILGISKGFCEWGTTVELLTFLLALHCGLLNSHLNYHLHLLYANYFAFCFIITLWLMTGSFCWYLSEACMLGPMLTASDWRCKDFLFCRIYSCYALIILHDTAIIFYGFTVIRVFIDHGWQPKTC